MEVGHLNDDGFGLVEVFLSKWYGFSKSSPFPAIFFSLSALPNSGTTEDPVSTTCLMCVPSVSKMCHLLDCVFSSCWLCQTRCGMICEVSVLPSFSLFDLEDQPVLGEYLECIIHNKFTLMSWNDECQWWNGPRGRVAGVSIFAGWL